MEVDTAPTVTDLSGELHACFALLERFVGSREPRLVANALRCVGPFRKKAKEAPAVAVGALLPRSTRTCRRRLCYVRH